MKAALEGLFGNAPLPGLEHFGGTVPARPLPRAEPVLTPSTGTC